MPVISKRGRAIYGQGSSLAGLPRPLGMVGYGVEEVRLLMDFFARGGKDDKMPSNEIRVAQL